jgi:regulator of RNase E activity RraA
MNPDSLVDRLARLPTSTLCDACAKSHVRNPATVYVGGLKRLAEPGTHVAGRARTQRMTLVRDHERSTVVVNRELTFSLVENASPGDFLVISAPAGPPYAIFGGMLALTARQRGAVGALVGGATRDVDEIAEFGLPVWAGGVTAIPGGFAGYSVTELGQPVNISGVEVMDGDLVVADGDGAVVLPADEAEQIIAICEEMHAAELVTRAAIKAGRTMQEAYPSRSYYAENSLSSGR